MTLALKSNKKGFQAGAAQVKAAFQMDPWGDFKTNLQGRKRGLRQVEAEGEEAN